MNGDLSRDCYEDVIYAGYLWFDASGIEPLFPFGYELSYTSFSMERLGIKVHCGTVTVGVKVRNAGKLYAGREVVQIYAYCPQTEKLSKERRRIGAVGQSRTRNAKGADCSLFFSIMRGAS